MKKYFQLMRLHKPIGLFLLLWPTLIALWIAEEGKPTPLLIFIFVLGVIIMRSAGCVINDIADRHWDGGVVRTKDRPLVTGALSLLEAKILFCILISIAFLLVMMLNTFALLVSMVALGFATLYPFMKRYTHFPQVVLGLAFSCSIPMVFAASQNQIPMQAIILFIANSFWVFAYDTEYAMVDRHDDIKVGIKSTAVLFERYDRLIISITMFFALFCFFCLGILLQFKCFYFGGLLGALLLICYQIYLIKDQTPQKCFRAFMNNHYVGASLFMGTFFEYF